MKVYHSQQQAKRKSSNANRDFEVDNDQASKKEQYLPYLLHGGIVTASAKSLYENLKPAKYVLRRPRLSESFI